jgi:general secretion pathway protein D
MKTNFVKLAGGVLAVLLCAAVELQAQQRVGGGGGGFPGFGGFGGFGGGNANRFGSGTSSSSYNNNGTVGNAVIQVDPVTHNLIVIADKQTSEQIRRVVESLDAPEPQVLIKVVFLEVQHNNAEELGVQGSFTGGNSISSLGSFVTNYSIMNTITSNGVTGTTTTTPTTVQTVTPATQKTVSGGNSFGLPQSLAGATGNGGLYQVLGNDFTATIQAVATAGKSQVLSRPSILARDGQMATIEIGQNIYLPSGVTYSSVGTSGVSVPSINGTYTPVGIILNVTPFVGDNGLVEMILEPQDSSVDTSSSGQIIAYGNSLIGSSPVYAPNINVTEANTVVVTPNGQTVVIGGLISNTKSSADSKVPFLGDIPLLGQLFRSSSTANSKTELLMFLTPHIVEAPSQLANLSSAEMRQTQIITNSVSEQELDRFLERVPVKKPAKPGKPGKPAKPTE